MLAERPDPGGRLGRFALLGLVWSTGILVPVLVLTRLGTPWPSAAAWRSAWSDRRVTAELAVPLGEAVFLALWGWALVAATPSLGSRPRVRAGAPATAEPETDRHEAVPRGVQVPMPVDHLPVSSWHDAAAVFDNWFDDVDVEHFAAPAPVEAAPPVAEGGAQPWEEPEWHVLVTVLGLVTASDRDGRRATFEKSRSLELLTWLTQHRERPTRGAARTALWDVSVKDSTFANVVSDLRRGLARLVPPDDGAEWVGRTLTDDLPLDPRVITDAELLQARLQVSRGMPAADAARLLRPGLALVTGMPFSGAGTTFGWADGEGHTSAAVLLITTAATELASHLLQLDDIDGVFWATGQGLKVLPGHEELIALRMQAHSARGDLAGVRLEWEQYERSITIDPWEHGAPSPKLASLRRDLLSAGRR